MKHKIIIIINMLWTILFILAIAYLIVYMIFLNIKIPYVIAGNISNECRSYYHKKFGTVELMKLDKKLVSPHKYFMGVVKGNSMMVRNLYDNDFFVADYITKPRETNFKKGDILVIRITNKKSKNFNKLKLREYVKAVDDNKIQTMTYENGKEKLSKPHNVDDVVAILIKKIKNI